MHPLSQEEIQWARSFGLLEKEETYFETVKNNPRKALGCIAGGMFIIAVIGLLVFLVGVM